MADEEFLAACKNGDLWSVKEMTSRGIDVNGRDDFGDTGLMMASWTSSPDVLYFLLNKGADHKVQNHRGRTALMFASKNSPEHVRALLRAGADPNQEDNDGVTALMMVSSLAGECASLLIEAGAEVNKKDRAGKTALMHGVEMASADYLRTLLEAGGNESINDYDNMGLSPLLRAVWTGSKEKIKLLMEYGADMTITKNGREGDVSKNALNMARKKDRDLASLMESWDLDFTTKRGGRRNRRKL